MNMPAYKDSKTGTWFVKFYCKDWTGENKQIKKRGFATKREALDYERNYKIRQENNLDMTFGEFWKLYTEDVKNYVKLNTWLTKENIVDTKIGTFYTGYKGTKSSHKYFVASSLLCMIMAIYTGHKMISKNKKTSFTGIAI